MAHREQQGGRAGFESGSAARTVGAGRTPASAPARPAVLAGVADPAPASEVRALLPGARCGLPDRSWLLRKLHERVPKLMAVYVFGSRSQGTARPDSDLDLAVLVAGYADPVLLFELAADLADELGHEVDLLDFRAASTVMQAQILTQGDCWWRLDASVEAYEAGVLNDKLSLDAARAGLLADIQSRGSVHGR